MLTRREEQASAILAEGCGRAEMARRLGVSVSAADKLAQALKAKLGATNRSELALRCRERLDGGSSSSMASEGIRTAADEGAGEVADELSFTGAATIDDLFARLLAMLAPLGVTDAAYSHIRRCGGGPIEHLASRWSFPPDVPFDMTIAPDDNLAFKQAMVDWRPAPLDLEAMMASDFYDYVPEPIKRQNEIFVAAGFARGITFVLPGLGLEDRLVLSLLLRGADREHFAGFLASHTDQAHAVAIAFRHAHVELARPRISLTPREENMLQHLADGLSIDDAAAAEGISRRVADRALEGARTATGRDQNTGALAAWMRDRASPQLDF